MQIYSTKHKIWVVFFALLGIFGCDKKDESNAAESKTPMSYVVGEYKFELDDTVRVVSRKTKNGSENPMFIMRFSLAGDFIPGSAFEPGNESVNVQIKPYPYRMTDLLPQSQNNASGRAKKFRFVRSIPEWGLAEYHRHDFDGGWGYVEYRSSESHSQDNQSFQCSGSVEKGVDVCLGHYKRDGYVVWYMLPFELMPEWVRVLDSVTSKVDSFLRGKIDNE